MNPELVLASASPRRAAILRQLGLHPLIHPGEVDERHLDGESPEEHVERLAREKAALVARRLPHALVVGGDTVVLDGARVLGKPRDREDATSTLLSLSSRAHTVLSGLAIAGPHGMVSEVTRTRVTFRPFDESVARRYVATGEPMDKAGSYGIQGYGAALVLGVEGDYYSVVGFPVSAFIALLQRAGWRYDFGTLTPIR